MVEMIQYFDDHWYKVKIEDNDIRYFASVTTKLGIERKPFLEKWRGDLGNREADYKMKQSQERGSKIHAAWEAMQNGKEIIYDKNIFFYEDDNVFKVNSQDEMMACYKLQQCFEIIRPEILDVETIVYSLNHSYAGTIDSVWKINEGEYQLGGYKPTYIRGGVYVVDLKTGKSVSNSAYEQVSAYSKALIEMNKYEAIEGTIILHTEAKTKRGIPGFQAILRDKAQYESDFQDFLLINALYDRRNAGKGPEIAKFPSNIKLTGINPKSV